MPALVQVTVKVIDCPLSIDAEGAIVTSVPVNWELTVTMSPAEQSETGEDAESVAMYE